MTILFKYLRQTLPLVAASVCMSSCVLAVKAETPTLGKEISDLKAARQKGALTEQEYQQQKALLLQKSKTSNIASR